MPHNLKNQRQFRAIFLNINYLIQQIANLINSKKDSCNRIISNSSLNLSNKTNLVNQNSPLMTTSYTCITSQLLRFGNLKKAINITQEVMDEKMLPLQLNTDRVDSFKTKSEEDKQLCDAIKEYDDAKAYTSIQKHKNIWEEE